MPPRNGISPVPLLYMAGPRALRVRSITPADSLACRCIASIGPDSEAEGVRTSSAVVEKLVWSGEYLWLCVYYLPVVLSVIPIKAWGACPMLRIVTW